MSIWLFILRRYASTSLSGFPVNSGLKWDQCNCHTGPGCTGGTAGCTGGAGCCVGGAGVTAGSAWAAGAGYDIGGPPLAILFMSWLEMFI